MGGGLRWHDPLRLPPAPLMPRFTVLVTCVGRRVSLLRQLKWCAAAERFPEGVITVATDSSPWAPGLRAADHSAVLPDVRGDDYLPALLDVVARHSVDTIIPVTDHDLVLLAKERERFGALGCRPAVGTPTAVEALRSKLETHRVLASEGVPTPRTVGLDAGTVSSWSSFPCVVKPDRGSGGIGVRICSDGKALDAALRSADDLVVQERLEGTEVTCDGFVTQDGGVTVVPRERVSVRAGEVEQSVTLDAPEVREVARRAVLAAGLNGFFALQGFVDAEGSFSVTEINPRLGGGVPLSLAAGADLLSLWIAECAGLEVAGFSTDYVVGLGMSRFDSAYFFQVEDGMPR